MKKQESQRGEKLTKQEYSEWQSEKAREFRELPPEVKQLETEEAAEALAQKRLSQLRGAPRRSDVDAARQADRDDVFKTALSVAGDSRSPYQAERFFLGCHACCVMPYVVGSLSHSSYLCVGMPHDSMTHSLPRLCLEGVLSY